DLVSVLPHTPWPRFRLGPSYSGRSLSFLAYDILWCSSMSHGPMDRRQDDLLDIKQAAQFLKVSETSLRRWTNSGRLACLRVGRKRERRFRRTDLLAFVEPQPVAGPAPTRPTGSHMCGLYASDLSRVDLAVG